MDKMITNPFWMQLGFPQDIAHLFLILSSCYEFLTLLMLGKFMMR